MKTRILILIQFIMLAGLLALLSCKKSQDPDPVQVEFICKIITPSDHAQIQRGTVVSVAADVAGFGDGVKVGFSVDSLQLVLVGEAPFEFLWDTKEWGTDTITIRADAFEDMQQVSDMITVILIDTIIPLQAPVPVIRITPDEGTTDTIFIFDASESHDLQDPFEGLLFRWDFEGDGEWDTDFSDMHTYEHKYDHVGHYHVRLEVMDSDTMSADTIQSLLVSHSTTPNPCEGIVSIPYGGKVYHTVPMGEQCWLRENLDIGIMIPGGEGQSNNQIIEKYCYNNDTANCDKYGGLYMWKEAMKHVPFQGGRGICPGGYHIPSDAEWKQLEGFVDSQYGIGDPEWDGHSFRGFDAGKRMKALLGWSSGGNGNNIFGFKVLASGYWEPGFSYSREGEEAHIWTSTHDSGQNAFKRTLKYDKDEISRSVHWDEAAMSVRCIRD